MHAYRMLLIYCRQFVLDLANASPRPHLLCCWPLDRMACPSSHRGNHHLLHPHEHPHALECKDDGRLQEDTWVVSERAQTSGNPQPQEASNCPCITKSHPRPEDPKDGFSSSNRFFSMAATKGTHMQSILEYHSCAIYYEKYCHIEGFHLVLNLFFCREISGMPLHKPHGCALQCFKERLLFLGCRLPKRKNLGEFQGAIYDGYSLDLTPGPRMQIVTTDDNITVS